MSRRGSLLIQTGVFSLVFGFALAPEALGADAKAVVKAGQKAAAPTVKRRATPFVKGVHKFAQYDWGGLYYYNRGEIEKARQYWMTALQYAEQEVPAERQRGLKPDTIKQTCDLIGHLTLFIYDDKFKAKTRRNVEENFVGNPSDPQSYDKHAYEMKKLAFKDFRDDWRWMERLDSFATRALGKQALCLNRFRQQQSEFQVQDVNMRYGIRVLESRLGLRPDPAYDRPLVSKGNPGHQDAGITTPRSFVPGDEGRPGDY